MIVSPRLGASGTGRRRFTTFVRLAAVLIGLANLTALAWLIEGDSPFWREDTVWNQALPVLAAVIAGLATSELVLRLFKRPALSENFFHRYAIGVFAVCLCGTLMGGLLAAMLGLDGALAGRSVTIPELILRCQQRVQWESGEG